MLQVRNTTRAGRASGATLDLVLHAQALFVICLVLFGSCQREIVQKRDYRQDNGWTYWAEAQERLGKRSWEYRLAYEDRNIRVRASLLTPLGTFEQVAAEDQYSNSGWTIVSRRTSTSVPTSATRISQAELEEGFYSSSDSTKLLGTPDSWAYLGKVINPGWVSPERLFDGGFLTRHPQEDGTGKKP